jgi:lipopolysaccharide export system protein LptA
MSRHNPDRSRSAPLCCAAALLLTLLGTGHAVALPDDQAQPIHITADQALRDEKQGVTVYSGNVHLNQGTLRIDADKLTIYHMSEELDQVIAEGSPATLQQQPDAEGGPVNARAHIITYYRKEDRVHLQREAHIERDGSIVTGDSIDYYITEQLVKADSDQEQEGSRVQVIIPPQATEQDRDNSGTTESE